MIGTMVAVLGGFAWMIARSYRQARRAPDAFRPEGKLRWTEEP
jgi:hypothetical protein